jgi:type IV pilus assembly protein PilX
MPKHYQQQPENQRGMVLVISLIMLMVLTMIGLSSTRISSLEVIMGVNTQNSVESLMLAEDSALAAEIKITEDFGGAPTINLSENTVDGFYLDSEIDLQTVDWSSLSHESVARTGHPDREYIVEYIGPRTLPGSSLAVGTGSTSEIRYLYRVSGRGDSERGSARVVQTIYALRTL